MIQRIADDKRDPRAVKFYHSKGWLALRLIVLTERPICEYCNEEIATDAHHVVPLWKDWARRLDPGNIKTIGPACHPKEEAKARRAATQQGVG